MNFIWPRRKFLEIHVLHEQQEENKEDEHWTWRNHGGRILKNIWSTILKRQVVSPKE
jgi:hypothetical protein